MIAKLQNKYYTVTQAAEKTGVTVSYVRQLLRSKKILGEKCGERAWLIPANQLVKLSKVTQSNLGRPRTKQK
jgi:excisionase family DNA binding protein